MPSKPKTFRSKDAPTTRERRRGYDRERGTERLKIYLSKWWSIKRKEIAERDDWMCKKCGKDIGRRKADYVIDHIIDRPLGAEIDKESYDNDANLQTLCVRCHNGKSKVK